MTIEVRQMLIRSVVVEQPPPAPDPRASAQQLEQLRQQIIKECKALIAEQLRQAGER